MKLPIGSGAVESLIRQVVNLRLKGTGKFWLLCHAEIMLHARCQWAAGTWAWANFCDSIFNSLASSSAFTFLTLNICALVTLLRSCTW